MKSEKHNALAELAEQLDRVGIELRYDQLDNESKDAVSKARRIIAELAKVKDEGEYPGSYDYKRACRDACEECRAIAEEGAKE